MVSANLLLEARRRAGLSQRELATRAGVGQQEIARYERGHVTPSLERLRKLIAACELELTFGLARADASYDRTISRMLAASPAQRLARGLEDAESARALGAHAQGAPAPADPVGVLRALGKAGVRYVLIGELAEVLRGSPPLPMSDRVTIVPRTGESEALRDALTAGRGRNASESTKSLLDMDQRWHLEVFCAELTVVPAPKGTHGYQDLCRDATQLAIDEDGLGVMVASLVDLVRISEASNDRARMPALRRTLELSTSESGTSRTENRKR